jgi:ubiquinol-cytochrome c reductase cytochrome c subunit
MPGRAPRQSPARHRSRRRPLLLVGAVIGVTLLLQLALAGREPSRAQSAGGAQLGRGRTLYQQNCATCHGQAGQGSQRGPGLIGVGAAAADYWLSTGRMPTDSEQRDPPRKQPAFGRSDIDALVAYVASLGGGPPVPPVDPAAGSLTEGHRLYQQNCAACHSAAGAGYVLQSGRAAPSLQQATPVQLAEAVRTGPGTMPPFDSNTISDRQLDSVARYVTYLTSSGDRGGLGLGRIGPITEGLVGWLVGLGLLVLVTRWLGKRAAVPTDDDQQRADHGEGQS